MNKIYNFILLLIPFFYYAQYSAFPVASTIQITEKTEYSKIKLHSDFVSYSKNNLNDLRIISLNEKDTIEHGYFSDYNRQTVQHTITYGKIFNTTKNNNTLSFEIDFGNVKSFNYLQFELNKNTDFDCFVSVLIPDNKLFDTVIKNERIVALHHLNHFYSFLKIQFPQIRQQYCKVIIQSRKTNELPDISSVGTGEQIFPSPGYSISKSALHRTENNKEKTTTLLIQTPKANYTGGISLILNDKTDFLRNLEIFYESPLNNGKSQWISFGHYTFSSFTDSLWISFSDAYDLGIYTNKIKVIIQNENNAPLGTIKSNWLLPEVYLYAKLEPQKEYWIMTGNKNVAEGNYDIVNFKSKILENTTLMKVVMTSEIKANPFFKSAAKDEAMLSSKNWLWFTIIVAAIVLVFFSVSMLKKVKNDI